MKKIYLLFCFTYLLNNVNAQSWCTPGSTWHYSVPMPGSGYIKYVYMYDTLVGSQLCNKIRTEGHGYGMGGLPINYVAYVYTYEQNGIVFKNNGTLAAPQYDTLYNFSGVVGTKWRANPNSPMGSNSCPVSYIEITGTGSMLIQGQTINYRKIFYKNYYMYPNGWIESGVDTLFERIGTRHNMEFISGAYCADGTDISPMYFRCFEDNQIQFNGTTQPCDYTTGITEQTLAANLLSVINPANETLKGSYSENSYSLSVADVNGRIVYKGFFTEHDFSINCSQFNDGVYLLQINGEKSRVTRKVIIRH